MFTTHTPVPAGHDAFPFNLVETHLAGTWGTLGEHRDAFLALGQYDNGSGPMFNMTALAMRSAGTLNGVSQLHGAGHARDVGADLARRADDQRPVRAITNGVHVPTWLSAEMTRLFDDYLGADWRERHDDPDALGREVHEIPTRNSGRRGRRCATTCSRSSASARERWKEEHVSAARVWRPAPCSIRTP